MGLRMFRPPLAVVSPLLTALPLCALWVAASLQGQVFVVGEKSAMADVSTEFHPTHVELSDRGLDERGRMDLIRNLESEQGFAHRQLPLGAGLVLLANGNMTPRDEGYKRMLYEKGTSAAPGDRVEISELKFGSDRIIIDFNGGPYARHRFLSHVSIDNMPLAQQGPIATGCRITLVFEGGIPDVTAAEVKSLLDPIVDFKAKSAAEAYANTLPPKVREAIEAHEILVGMDRRMVIAALGEPHDKHREHLAAEDESSPVLEEWIYGQPPEPTQFVRFRSGRVVRLEIAAIGKPLEIREKDEIGGSEEPSLLPRTIQNGDDQRDPNQAAKAPPTLRRPGEVLDAPVTEGRVRLPMSTSPQPATPPQ